MIQNIIDFFVRKKIFFAFLGILVLFLGRPSLFPWVSPIAAVSGYSFLWLAISEENSFKKRLHAGWLYFFLTFLLSTAWLLSHPYSYMYAVWILLAALFSFPFAILSAWSLKKPLSFFSIVLFSLAFSLLEKSFTLIACGFPFISSALYFTSSLSSLQLAFFIGETGLSFIVFATNLLFLRSFQQKKISLLLVGMILLPYVGGGLILWKRFIEKQLFDQKNPLLKCAIIHTEEKPDVFSDVLTPEALVQKEWGKVFELLSTLTPGSVDLIVLPEGVIPYAAEAELFALKSGEKLYISSLDVAKKIAHHFKAPLILGLEGRSYKNGTTSSYNSCYFVPDDGTSPVRYDKQLLLPFGEYIPSEKLKNVLAAYGVHDSFSPGKEPVLFEKGALQLTPFICYEEIFSFYTKKALKLNPHSFVSISSDCWFPSKMLAEEHFSLARLRAVEAGRPLIRSCNMGVSAAIDALGQIVARSDGSPACFTTSLSQWGASAEKHSQ